jgi:hypothetical protein
VLYTFVVQGGSLNEGEKEKLRMAMTDVKADDWGFGTDEWEALERGAKA